MKRRGKEKERGNKGEKRRDGELLIKHKLPASAILPYHKCYFSDLYRGVRKAHYCYQKGEFRHSKSKAAAPHQSPICWLYRLPGQITAPEQNQLHCAQRE